MVAAPKAPAVTITARIMDQKGALLPRKDVLLISSEEMAVAVVSASVTRNNCEWYHEGPLECVGESCMLCDCLLPVEAVGRIC